MSSQLTMIVWEIRSLCISLAWPNAENLIETAMSTSSRNQAAISAIFPHKYLNKHSYRVHALYWGILTIRLV